MPSRFCVLFFAAFSCALSAQSFAAGLTDPASLQSDLEKLTGNFDGRVGICVRDQEHKSVSINGVARFPMQSVVKLIIAAAAFDAMNRSGGSLDEPVIVHHEDLSLAHQPMAKLVDANGFHTTLGDLARRAIMDSDCAASDIVFRRIGGVEPIADFLARSGCSGIRADRDERHLQTEIVGLEWTPEYVDADTLQKAEDGVPEDRRTAAFEAYANDPRDTATPEGMTVFLEALATGKLLSSASTAQILNVMDQTVTGPDRLMAGIPADWKIGHKTGTSGDWHGVTAATNDVGILRSPRGDTLFVSVFIAGSRRTDQKRAALIAEVARRATAACH